MSQNFNGRLVGKKVTSPFSGVFTLNNVAVEQRAGNWPLATVPLLAGFNQNSAVTAFTASTQISSARNAEAAFDNSTDAENGCWHSTINDVGWLKIQFSSARRITRYKIWRRAGGFDQRVSEWTLQGSNDNSNWTDIHNAGESGTGASQTITWPSNPPDTDDLFDLTDRDSYGLTFTDADFTNNTAYTYYRFDVNEIVSNYAVIGEIALYGY